MSKFKEDNANPTICLQSAVRRRSHVTSLYHVTRYLINEFLNDRGYNLN